MIQIADLQMKPFSFGGGSQEPEQLLALAQEAESAHIQHGVWQCGPGEIDLTFDWTETVYILEGRAEIENLCTQEKYAIVPGSMMLFEKGSRWKWRIPWKLKKIFTLIE